MAIEYCVRCGKRVTGDDGAETGGQRLCVWCIDKNPVKGTTARRNKAAPADSTTSASRILRSPALWIAVVVLAAGALTVGLVFGRLGSSPPTGSAGDAEKLRADFAADASFERRDELMVRFESLKAAGGPALESAALEYEHRREKTASAKRDSVLRDAETLAADEKYEEALALLAGFPKALAGTPAGIQVEARRKEVESVAAAVRAIEAGRWSLRIWPFPLPAKDQPPSDWDSLVKSKPAHVGETPELVMRWDVMGPKDMETDGFALQAEMAVDLPARDYVITVESDDGARLWIDEKLAFSNWQPHAPREDRTVVALAAGRHVFRVDYYELRVKAILVVKIKPKP